MAWILSEFLSYDLRAILRPVRGVSLADKNAQSNDPNTWFVADDNALLASNSSMLGNGWFMVELQLQHKQANVEAVLSWKKLLNKDVDYNEYSIVLDLGHSENSKTRVVKRLIYLPIIVSALYFRPLSKLGAFRLLNFRLVRLSLAFARNRIARRLVRNHRDYKGLLVENVIKTLKCLPVRGEGGQLALYNATFVTYSGIRGYHLWIQDIEVKARLQLLSQMERKQKSGVVDLPLISLIIPVCDISFYENCIASVISQHYNNWQLCVVDLSPSDDGGDLGITQDSRINVIHCPKDSGYFEAITVGIQQVKGDYVVFVDQFDELPTHALSCVATAIVRYSEVMLFYSDEDQIDDDGIRSMPHFKPSWNPDLLLSTNYISNLCVFQTKRLREVVKIKCIDEYDLLLKYTADLSAEKIMHIPHVLYHSRKNFSKRTLVCSRYKKGVNNSIAVLRSNIQYLKLSANVVTGLMANSCRVVWQLPEPPPLVSLIIPTRDKVEVLKKCIDAILENTTYAFYELIIVDNQSTCPNTLAYISSLSEHDDRIKILKWNHEFNYSAINNYAVEHASGSVIGLINNDVEPISSDWLTEMVAQVCRPEIGCVGAKLYYPDGTVQHAGVILGIGGIAGHAHKYFDQNDDGYFGRLKLIQNYSAVTGACLLVRKSVFEKVGGLNEEYLKVAFNDVDFCLRVGELGYRNLWTPYAELYHHESLSRGKDTTPAKKARFEQEKKYMKNRWGEQLKADPAYNANLSLSAEDFSLSSF